MFKKKEKLPKEKKVGLSVNADFSPLTASEETIP